MGMQTWSNHKTYQLKEVRIKGNREKITNLIKKNKNERPPIFIVLESKKCLQGHKTYKSICGWRVLCLRNTPQRQTHNDINEIPIFCESLIVFKVFAHLPLCQVVFYNFKAVEHMWCMLSFYRATEKC